MRKMRYTKGARYKNNPKREYAITNTKKNASLYTLGVESLTSAPGEARYSEFTKKGRKFR